MNTTAIKIEEVRLDSGPHKGPSDGFCAMELAAHMAGEKWSASPDCVSPVIAAFLRRWNDDLDDEARQALKPYVPRVLNTRSTADVESRRAWMATDWMVRTYTPAWLELGGMVEQANALRDLPEITAESVSGAMPNIREARDKAAAARAAAWAAAGDAAWDAARAAAGDAARAAAWAAAWAAAGDAAWDAAKAKLQPTVTSLTESAFALLDRLIAA